MKVGEPITGGLKSQREVVAAERQYHIMNMSPEKQDLMEKNMLNRGSTTSAFEGENHFRGLKNPKEYAKRLETRDMTRRYFSQMMQYDTPSKQ